MAELDIRVLGRFHARLSSGRSVELATRKTRGLLAYLSLHAGLAQSREKLIALLWGDREEKQGRDSLRQALTALRRGLGSDGVALLKVDTDAIAIEPTALAVDAVRFEQLVERGTPGDLESAVDLYQGDFLDGIGLRDPAFENWMYAERERLRGRAVEALAKLLAHQVQSDGTDRAVATAARLLQLDPLQEAAHRALMQLHAQRGQRGLALRQYQVCTDLLKRELGVTPDPQTVALYDSIRRARDLPIRSNIELSSTAEAEESADLQGIPTGLKEVTLAPQNAPPEVGPLAERRHLTIVFVDLVGSMELSAQLDPEQMQELLADYQKTIAKEAARFKGYVANIMGDGMLVYFGWPSSHEDDAERAVRASLSMRDAVRALRSPEGSPLTVRIGIASGLIVVGEGNNQDAAVVGETPNLASRLRALASQDQIIIAGSTRCLLGDTFEVADLGAQNVRDYRKPVQAFAVIGERRFESRFDARSGPTPMPMVSRDQELALLLERWALAKSGEGQGVLLVGEAGIGKSRIIRALLDAVAEETLMRIRYQCSPNHSDSSLWPVVQQLTNAAGLVDGEPLEAGLDKLDKLLRDAGHVDSAPLISSLIGLDGTARYGRTDLTPQTQRAHTLRALVEQLSGLAARQPVLMVVEDVHWIDATTLELIEHVLDRIVDARILVLLTSRPDQQPTLPDHPHVTRLVLNRLGRAAVEAMVVRLGGDRLPVETINAIIARTDGVPLFVEELTKAVLETGETAIPASLHDSLMARLDRIPEVKEVAQVAACIGREFDYPLLAAVVDRTEPSLQSALDRLVAAELVFRRGIPPKISYSFKHALVRDAAYESLLKSRRQQLHTRIAQHLQTNVLKLAETQPEIIAHHLTCANLNNRACDFWLAAGLRNASRSAYVEATSQLTMALQTASGIADPLLRQEKELEIRSFLASALRVTRGHVARELEVELKAMLKLAEELGKNAQSCHALNGLALVQLNRGELTQARSYAIEALTRASQADERTCELLSRRTIGTVLFLLGEFTDARAELQRCVDTYNPEHDRTLIQHYSFDPLVAAHGFLSWTSCVLGYPDVARQHLRAGHKHASELEHGYSIIFSHLMSAVLHLMLQEPGPARVHAEAAIGLSAEQRLPYFSSIAKACQGWAQAKGGCVVPGLTRLREGLEAHQAVPWEPLMHCSMAESLAAVARVDEALECLTAADLVVEQTHAYWWAAETARVRGGVLLATTTPELARAESSFEVALALARAQRAKWWELRAAINLARHWSNQGRRAEAQDLVAPIYGWFTEGFDTVDLKGAEALLNELG